MSSFAEFGLSAALNAGLSAAGYVTPTPIQNAAIPPALQGRDVLGLAQTGTGKTAAFSLPILAALEGAAPAGSGAPLALIVLPTRELALQVAEVMGILGGQLRLRTTVVHGGVSLNPQMKALAIGVDILVATPGRLLDLMQQGAVRLASVRLFVLDEADRMLDMGFLPDVRRLVAKLPAVRQTMFFSATMPDDVSKLASGLLRDHVRVQVAAPATTVERIEQSVLHVDPARKVAALVALLSDPDVSRAIVFTRTKHGANKLVQQLVGNGVGADAYHSNKSQPARERALGSFKAGATRALVATDIAARGIDVDGVSHVFNFDLPEVAEAYVHRIGRTGRAGRAGIAISLCTPADRELLKGIEKLIRQPIPRAVAPAGLDEMVLAPPAPKPAPQQQQPSRNRNAGRGRPNPGSVTARNSGSHNPGHNPGARTTERSSQNRPTGSTQDGQDRSGVTEARPAPARPAPARPVQARPAQGRPAPHRGSQNRPADSRHTESRHVESRPAEQRPVEQRSAVARQPQAAVRERAVESQGEWAPEFLRPRSR
jgi:ATP-dependent RNA helicase RhlE